MPSKPKATKTRSKTAAVVASHPEQPGPANLAQVAPAAPKRRGRKPTNAWRKHITYPGLLEESVIKRCDELFYKSFSLYATELVCYDMRKRFPHIITFGLTKDDQALRDWVDKQIVVHYEPGKPRDKGLLLRIVRGEVPPLLPDYLRHLECSLVDEHVYFPGRLKDCIETRWQELGYQGISDYVTALIRYDLALGGEHNESNGTICDRKILAELDEWTAQIFAEGKVERIRLIDFIEESLGRKLNMEEAFTKIEGLLDKIRGMFCA